MQDPGVFKSRSPSHVTPLKDDKRQGRLKIKASSHGRPGCSSQVISHFGPRPPRHAGHHDALGPQCRRGEADDHHEPTRPWAPAFCDLPFAPHFETRVDMTAQPIAPPPGGGGLPNTVVIGKTVILRSVLRVCNMVESSIGGDLRFRGFRSSWTRSDVFELRLSTGWFGPYFPRRKTRKLSCQTELAIGRALRLLSGRSHPITP